MLRRQLILLILLALSFTLIFAQGANDGAAPGDQTPVFSADTTLIEFTLIAIDKDGKPVTDLKKEEIIVKDKGQPGDLALFRYEGGEQPQTVPELPPGIFTNTPALTPGPPRNITAIVLDTLNTQPREQTWVKAQAMRYLGTLLPNPRLAVYLLGQDLTVLHDFTDDAESLLARIEQAQVKLAGMTFGEIDDMAREMETLISSLEVKRLKPEQIARYLNIEMRAHEAADEQRTRNTLSLLEALGDHRAGIPGRKSIVWFGSGISMLSIVGSLERGIPGSNRSYEDLVRDTSRRLAQQGITMYMFDARGMQVQSNMSVERGRAVGTSLGEANPHERLQANATISADTTPAMAMFANLTGGRFYWNTNDLGRAVDEIVADSEGTYSLGFYAEGEPDDKWHNLNVSVTRKGVKLKHRDGYLSAAPTPRRSA
jgi:VWFA-related protein